MKTTLSALALVACGLTPSLVGAQDHTLLPSIAGAAYAQYRGEYGQSPVCMKDEITLWSCATKQRVFSLCSSQTGSRTTGYLQYRASDAGKLTFVYPATKMPPLGLFKYNASANGDAFIEFSNKGYQYRLGDPLRGASVIEVSSLATPAKTTTIACGPNQTLQVNYSMRLMHDFGVWNDD